MLIHPDAKINLGLNVVNKRKDGFHDLETVFYHVPLYDTIEINVAEDTDRDCELTVSGIEIGGNPDDNLVVKAYRLLAADYALPKVRIRLTKCIPSQAGMGGGSSDCAFTLRLLNDMFSLGIGTDKLREYAARLGSDCAFFIDDRPEYAEGKGELLSPVEVSLKGFYFAVVKPDVAVSTKEAYSNVKVGRPAYNCREVVTGRDVKEWKYLLKNDFEDSIFPQHPVIREIKDKLYSMGAVFAMMSGSGSAVFGLFSDEPADLQHTFRDCFTKVVMLEK